MTMEIYKTIECVLITDFFLFINLKQLLDYKKYITTNLLIFDTI
jgi:hypothetical protein